MGAPTGATVRGQAEEMIVRLHDFRHGDPASGYVARLKRATLGPGRP